jgi:hypothetical protein
VYYRVGLYGTEFGDENKNEYILKVDKFKKVWDLKKDLQKLYKEKLNVCFVYIYTCVCVAY